MLLDTKLASLLAILSAVTATPQCPPAGWETCSSAWPPPADGYCCSAAEIKKEMAEATAKEHKLNAEKAAKRYEKSMAERKHNVERLHQAETNDLRDEMEIANERREGTSMNKGSKSDFLTAMRSSGKADDKEFV